MRLHQIRMEFDAEQDRLLLLISTSDGAEVRAWLTRRYVNLLWPLLLRQAEELSPRIAGQADQDARKALLGMEHAEATARADFSKPYERVPRSMPLGEAPILMTRIQTARDPRGLPIITMNPSQGQGVSLTLDKVLLHSVCRLLQTSVAKSDWGLDLKLPGKDLEHTDDAVPRVLN
jgi:hypothetical protein